MNSTSLFLEIGQNSIKALHGEAGLEVALTRGDNGRLTPGCRQEIVTRLQSLIDRKGWPGRVNGVCAISARGLSLRRIHLPAAPVEEQERVLLLQIESEFPLSPAELAWGGQPLVSPAIPRVSGGDVRDLTVAAVRRELVEEYAGVLEDCGVAPIFTVAALVRASACPQPSGNYAILDFGRQQSELVVFEDGVPLSVRLVAWGGEDLNRSLISQLGVDAEEAERIKLRLDQHSVPEGEFGQKIQSALNASLDLLTALLKLNGKVTRIFLTGKTARNRDLAPDLSQRLGVTCERVEIPNAIGVTAAILGARRACERGGGLPPMVLGRQSIVIAQAVNPPALWKWAAAAVLLLLGVLAMPYAEAYWRKDALSARLMRIRSQADQLPTIEREYGFLEFLKANQAPYSDALVVIANSAPQGVKLEAVSMNRHGEVTLRGAFPNASQVTDFRNKLIKSGFFQTASVDEQAPIPNQNGRVNLRMSLQWKPPSAREGLKIDLAPATPGQGGGGGFNHASFTGMPPEMLPQGIPEGMPPSPVTVNPGGRKEGSSRKVSAVPASGDAPVLRISPGGAMPPGVVSLPEGITLPANFVIPVDGPVVIQQTPPQ